MLSRKNPLATGKSYSWITGAAIFAFILRWNCTGKPPTAVPADFTAVGAASAPAGPSSPKPEHGVAVTRRRDVETPLPVTFPQRQRGQWPVAPAFLHMARALRSSCKTTAARRTRSRSTGPLLSAGVKRGRSRRTRASVEARAWSRRLGGGGGRWLSRVGPGGAVIARLGPGVRRAQSWWSLRGAGLQLGQFSITSGVFVMLTRWLPSALMTQRSSL